MASQIMRPLKKEILQEGKDFCEARGNEEGFQLHHQGKP